MLLINSSENLYLLMGKHQPRRMLCTENGQSETMASHRCVEMEIFLPVSWVEKAKSRNPCSQLKPFCFDELGIRPLLSTLRHS